MAFVLALRLLNPAGFMPTFDHGTLTIIECPDASFHAPPAMAMQHRQHSKHQQQCPYAAASSLSALGADFAPLLDVLIAGTALLLGRSFLFIERHRSREWPPLRGPPLPS